MKRKHVRTRRSMVGFQNGPVFTSAPMILEPGVYRMYYDGDRYYASFVIRKDHTVELYGNNLDVRRDDTK